MTQKTKFPLVRESFTKEELAAAADTLYSKKNLMGEKVREFERALAEWTGNKYALMVNSGSSANLLLTSTLLFRSRIKAQLRPGDEILVPALCWPTTIWPLIQLGLKPVFVDVNPETLNLDLNSAKRAVTSSAKAMIVVHALGLAADMEEVAKFCEHQGLYLIEDGCESFGAFFNGRHVGSFGQGGSFSHHASNQLNTFEGGSIVTQDEELFNDLVSLRSHGGIQGRTDYSELSTRYAPIDSHHLYVIPGFNVAPLELQAVLGLGQLSQMDQILKSRQEFANEVHGILKTHAPFIKMIGAEYLNAPAVRSARRHSWHSLALIFDEGLKLSLVEIRAELLSKGLETSPLIAGHLAAHPVRELKENSPRVELTQAEMLSARGIAISCPSRPTEEDLEFLKNTFEYLNSLLS